MSYWLTDPELFLYTKTNSDDVHLWRCKTFASSSSSSSSSPPIVVPMKLDDFKYEMKVTSHRDLVESWFPWDDSVGYRKMLMYIHARRLLVNCEGLVIVELHKFGEDGKIDQNKLPIYIRSVDVLLLKSYIPFIGKQSIPPRTVQYLEDVNGRAARMLDFTNTEAVARLQDEIKEERRLNKAWEKEFEGLKDENKVLEVKNNTLEGDVKKLTANLDTRMNELVTSQQELNQVKSELNNKVVNLEFKNTTLEADVRRLTINLTTKRNELVSKQQELNQVKSELNNKVVNLEFKNTTLEADVRRLTLNLTTKTNELVSKQQELNQVNIANSKEVWMSDYSWNDWVGVEGLIDLPWVDDVRFTEPKGTFTEDLNTSNVRSRYLRGMLLNDIAKRPHRALAIDDLVPNKEKARFHQGWWWTCRYKGIAYVITHM